MERIAELEIVPGANDGGSVEDGCRDRHRCHIQTAKKGIKCGQSRLVTAAYRLEATLQTDQIADGDLIPLRRGLEADGRLAH
jgi:hypothetical protein